VGRIPLRTRRRGVFDVFSVIAIKTKVT